MKILNFGSLNVDYIYEVENFVLPGETISSNNLVITTGGKGLNQSIALAKAGATPFHAGAIGSANEDMFIGLLNMVGVNIDHIEKLPGPSGHAIIQVDKNGQNCIVLYGGANQQINNKFVDGVLNSFSSGDIILLQNEISSVEYIMEKAYKKGMKIYFNPSPANQKLYEYPLHYVDVLILNEVEGEQLTGGRNADNITEILLKRYPEMKIVLTLGEGGVTYADKDRRENHGIFDTVVVDTTAAGDTFTGYFIASAVKGIDIRESLKYSSAAAAIAVSRLGAACSIPTLQEVEEFIKHQMNKKVLKLI
ncbi:ribokinase [Alkaliphilus peptidifermentans]|uniref:Ribokinase n=1 Tax=Alkaliphilus peptidifermentans DSM 18978 TaxID=1120976 RepID=A0A1G5FZB6_9FIRM|nr:ribokinase [Alkaliphilus peptidifermentans]SCY44596.1 ribokinase [Alkaliphilus peptidifermentans DSM 18978]